MTDHELLLSIHTRLGEIQGHLTMHRRIFSAVVSGGIAWLSFITLYMLGFHQ